MSVKLLTRAHIEKRIPPLRDLDFNYWAFSKARINIKKKRIIKGKVYNFYTPQAARKLEAVLRKQRPDLFTKESAALYRKNENVLRKRKPHLFKKEAAA